ncbi:Serpentine receptor class r-10 [Caenorhabditis elegans]|uniref:Serpentine receptor class r-10 n=2 Tax=Caenorhabditis elegans TaxID=6239 RepID=O17230_CAEEL|nr:Seven TM Receptor [Caenorhabditis elegans]CCD71281.1 Seven TM Receptor [Caenorhabditis elegans]|eukprot:NP_493898.1 Seven TM Receptor [Caenorhabditis elegans]
MLWLHIIQYSGFFMAQVTNALLVYLIWTKAEKLFGTYRHVMCTFALYSLVYAWIEVLTQPVMHIKGPIFIVIMDSPLKYQKWIGNDLTCLYCGSFALVISLLAAQFFYRYVAMCRSNFLQNIEGIKLTFIFIPCLVCFVLWFEFVYWGMSNTVEKQLYMREEIEAYYNEDSTKVSFIAPMYWSVGTNGEKIWKFWEIMSSVECVCIIAVCFSTILFCASNIYFTMKSASGHMSRKTLELNRQLFITLTFQTILPFVMMYSPVGLLIVLPLFEVYVGSIANFVGASLAVYPSLEPLIAMFCIKEFRKTVTCPSLRKVTPATVSYTTSSRAV